MEFGRINPEDLRSTSLLQAPREDVDLFLCSGQPRVESFFKEKAEMLERTHACKTHVMYYNEQLIGFYTLFADYVTLVTSKRNKEGWKDVATALGNQHFPAVRLHYLAVHEQW
ncbi:hypothetical protein [Salibacterium halotolerans]|uniref:Acetyltransferase (GNAT) domain-containing protein n=1 Tax=Salibacterium halotolerans TaxID=1884432 RepID=A0A1I5VVV1_9BACI|nr:hypothetical protein [Salibacterium halotolerans]SFQ11106.1 hypothetical protein SAMN05518683_11758 [Salibacterium halotolerans]